TFCCPPRRARAASPAAAPPAPTARLAVTVNGESGTVPMPCRAWVEVSGKKFYRPLEASCSPYPRDQSFACRGTFTLDLPAGPATVHVERDKKYVPMDKAVRLRAGQTTQQTLTLRRWIDMNAQGWYSADMHVHFPDQDRRLADERRFPADIETLKNMA